MAHNSADDEGHAEHDDGGPDGVLPGGSDTRHLLEGLVPACEVILRSQRALIETLAPLNLSLDVVTSNLEAVLGSHQSRAELALQAFDNSIRAHLSYVVQPLLDLIRASGTGVDWNLLNEIADGFQNALPTNLRGVDDLELVASVTLDEGIPLAWVPRRELVEKLLSAKDAQDRLVLLDDMAADVLRDCEDALSQRDNECAMQCGKAVGTLRDGHDAPAQSHAANLVDSIVLGAGGKNGRATATSLAKQSFAEVPFVGLRESLVLRPLFRAYASWFPHDGTPPPGHFARHATAHAAGDPGVFTPRHALIAVMLATSLAVEFSDAPESESENGNS